MCRMEGVDFAVISPYVRMMRLKKVTTMLSGKWRDIDHVYTYIASGSADFIIAGVRYQLHRGNAIIIPPYMTHMIIPDGEEPFVQYIIHFDFYDTPERRALIHKDVLDEAERQLTIPPKEDLLHQQVVVSEIPESERNRLVRRYLDMMREFHLDRPGKDVILRSECTTFLIYAWRYQIDGESRISRNPIKTKAWIHIEKAIDYIQSCEPGVDMDNDSIAAVIGVTPNYLTGIFQSHLGISLHRYVTNIRIDRARQMLLKSDLNITEVARQTGFSGIHVFSKTFKNLIGVSPSQFLDEMVSREQIEENMSECAEGF